MHICIFRYNTIEYNPRQQMTGGNTSKDLPGRLQKITSITEQLRRELANDALDRGELRDNQLEWRYFFGIEWDTQPINIMPEFFLNMGNIIAQAHFHKEQNYRLTIIF